uniref:Cold shock protein-like n=1 Tax=Karlodinium veneficum TaxID=407301 RepID=A7YXU7_KARVE|nr:cold shock protein-like [Karlodinium veneficum]ABV22227.1 cold shock protein-like [Karlodinium veneficum]|mmetsp:Transcript_24480/g.39204  ORF Transcript_24480/g.39204 Transcript_24480/m.39204 type:complete len:211 (+) Transcript_24480:69-701(+)|eukprot:CAMPEP_0169119886 /NCGR_PEP_ID=MMETSP1015-20121227/31805_1 /TAXON_ID=342587 /ORGANISM="Karlodinium micrum, Strain CCMP2283" /LENGTH=210 /DNA_ID=CAMNT_0009182815 /DNA_START=62 /DNA_END=694 /DNA_ORIENTATION=+
MATRVGTVKSYNVHKGWGFVECNGTDVFLMHKELGGKVVSPGDKLKLTITTGEKGKPQASNVSVISSAGEEKYKGRIKSFVQQKGYGFITCDALQGQDIFFMKSDVSERALPILSANQDCTFTLHLGDRGPQAKDITLVGAAGNAVKEAMSGGGGMMTVPFGGGSQGSGGVPMVPLPDVMKLVAMLQGGGGGGMNHLPVQKHMFQKKKWN